MSKLDNRANEAIMIGYAFGSRGYRLWDFSRHHVVISRGLRFEKPDPPRNDLSDHSKTAVIEDKECDKKVCESSEVKKNN